MELRKQTYTAKNKDGTKTVKTCKRFYLYISARETGKINRRIILPMTSRANQSQKWAATIEKIISANGNPSPALQAEIAELSASLVNRLVKQGLLAKTLSQNAGKSLTEHLDAYYTNLYAKGATDLHCYQTKTTCLRLFELCGFECYGDINSEAIENKLAELREDRTENDKIIEGMGQRTSNYYMTAAKSFCRWMRKTKRATYNPLEDAEKIKQTEFRHNRHYLTVEQQRILVETTQNGPVHHNMTGPERSLLYRLAIETGYRAKELRGLTVSSFNFQDNTVKAQSSYGKYVRINTKNKKPAIQFMKPETAAMLKAHLAGKMPDVKAFKMPNQPAKMIKADVEAAGIDYIIDGGFVDFHSLRRDFITNVIRSGVSAPDAVSLARHSSIEMTMRYYTAIAREDQRKIINSLPDLSAQSQQKNFAK